MFIFFLPHLIGVNRAACYTLTSGESIPATATPSNPLVDSSPVGALAYTHQPPPSRGIWMTLSAAGNLA